MSTLYVDNLQPNLGSRVMAAGHVVQVLQAHKSDTFTSSGGAFVDVTGLSLSITPTETSSKILVITDIALGYDQGSYCYYRVMRDSTQINGGDVSTGQPNVTGMFYDNSNNGMFQRQTSTYLDSPATTASVTYKIQLGGSQASGYNQYVNRSDVDTANTYYYPRSASSLILMEIAQ